jgi:hypothetical protein
MLAPRAESALMLAAPVANVVAAFPGRAAARTQPAVTLRTE